MKKLLLAAALLMSLNAVAQEKEPVRCAAITTKGVQCKRMASDGKYCKQHSLDTPHCGAMTTKGTPCKVLVAHKGDKCKLHS